MQVGGFAFIVLQMYKNSTMPQTPILVLAVQPVKRTTTLHLIKMILLPLVLKQQQFQAIHGAVEPIVTALMITITQETLVTLAAQNLLNREQL